MLDQTAPETQSTPLPMPALSSADIAGIPSSGTGLEGAAYIPGSYIGKITTLEEVIAEAREPELTFTASKLLYGARKSETTVAEFLGDDANSIIGNGDAYEMGPSGLVFTGYVYVPAGSHEITVRSDDGFKLSLGGQVFSEHNWSRGTEATSRTETFEGGYYEMELLYFDQGGAMTLSFEMDGLPIHNSAFHTTLDAVTNPDPDVDLIPVDGYHPAWVLGEEAYGSAISANGTDRANVISGRGGDDDLSGSGGADHITGGYGNDRLDGGDGNDVLDGGRGMDLLLGGDGDDVLISRSDAGEQRIGQLATGNPTREDPDGEVNEDRQKLIGWEDQPLKSDDILVGGAGADVFLISPQINAKLDIIQKHVRADGTIKWSGVAGENNELHDHWVDSFGIDLIADYVAGEDKIAVIGHTATVTDITYVDTDGDGDLESIVTVLSKQHGGGGAHDNDLIGQIIVHGDKVTAEDITTDAAVTYGIVETYAELAEALKPAGETRVTVIEGETVYGYDTRTPDGSDGPITGDPASYFENPFAAEVTTGDPSPETVEMEPTRAPFEQLGTTDEAATEADGLPGALGYWSFADGVDGSYADARGGPAATAYALYENQAHLRSDGGAVGPDGTPGSALAFNGEDSFAFIAHDPAYQVTQGTIALWVRPDNLDDCSVFLSKDQRNTGDGGHFRLGHTDDGGLILRMAPGNGESNKAWVSDTVLTEGAWAHIAVSYTADGVAVYVDGRKVPDGSWTKTEGDVANPGDYTEAYFIANQEPWVLGADTRRTEDNDTAQSFALDDEDLDNPFEGAIADLGIWGGFTAGDALTGDQVRQLIDEGPGTALTNPSGQQPILATGGSPDGGDAADEMEGTGGDDVLSGKGGHDDIAGGYGDDKLNGGSGNDTLDGGRGSDLLVGGSGDDLLISRADVGEDRAGQLVLDDPSRPLGDSISPDFLKLYDWIDQPIVGDDILVGGAGKDTFRFETLINAKMDILLKHTMENRMIHWHGVAGENREIHDHWVDSLGIEVIADYNADDDTIEVIGHTTNVEVDYKAIDSDGDGAKDSIVSIITVYSQQGGGGGAHDEDYLGYIVVHGDMVREEDIVTDAGAHYGIVDTIDEIQEAVAPTGETKTGTAPTGEALFGYDSRDVSGDPIGTDPEAYASNKFAGDVTYADANVTADPAGIVATHAGGQFDGSNVARIAHDPAMAQESGTVAFTFTADSIGRDMMLISKDHSGYKTGGHLSIWINAHGKLKARFQSETETRYLYGDKVEAGIPTNVAFSFTPDQITLYRDGALRDSAEGFRNGMTGNDEELVIGASTKYRREDDDRLEWFFEGSIGNLSILDRAISEVEAVLLDDAGGDPLAIGTNAPLPDVGDDVAPEPEPEPATELDVIEGDNDRDVLRGTDQDEHLIGKDGDDRIMGGGGNDSLEGGADDDRLKGGSGDDTLEGGAGNDRLFGGADADRMSGGTGNDRYIVDSAEDVVIEKANAGRDWVLSTVSYTLTANVESLRLRGGDLDGTGNGEDNRISGTHGNNLLTGLDGVDRLLGLDGNDTLMGGDGDDRLIGGDGADILDGGAGRDRMRGGDGADQFRLGSMGEGENDRILDFFTGSDTLVLNSDVFDISDPATQLVVGSGPTSPITKLYYDQEKGRLFYDADGSGLASAGELVVTLGRGTALSAEDIQIA